VKEVLQSISKQVRVRLSLVFFGAAFNLLQEGTKEKVMIFAYLKHYCRKARKGSQQ